MKFDVNILKFNDQGLIPCITQDAQNKDVLMMAWMNEEAVLQTLETNQVTYWSRSRQELWVKGATSGNSQSLVSFRYDCDQDTILLLVYQKGPACHTGRRSCFFTEIVNRTVVDITTIAEDERSS